MRALYITKHGGHAVLRVRENPDPLPDAGQVRVRVHAAGLNFAEVMARKGLYPDAPKPPCVVGYEGAGVVDALGRDSNSLRVGQRVLFLSRFGAHADMVCVPASQVAAIPDHMSFEEAAAIPVNYLTAYHMLFNVTRVRSGDHVLIHMAAGGVGTAMLQLCSTVPGIVSYGTCSRSKHEYAKSQGLMHAIDYHSEDYVETIKRLTGGLGVHYVYDALGGADFKKGYSILRTGGMLVAFGVANVSSGEKRSLVRAGIELLKTPRVSAIKLMDENKGFAGVNLGHMWKETSLLKDGLQSLIELYKQGKIKPHVHAAVPLSRGADGHEMLETGKNLGKVLLIPD